MRQETTKNTASKKPVSQNGPKFYVSTPTEYTDKDGEIKTRWTTIGSAFETKNGIMVRLNALPITGKLYLAEPSEQD